MTKSDLKKRAEMMAKEWKKSRSTTRSLNDLVGMGLLHNQELGGWRAPEGESYPDPRAGEIIVFEDYLKRGFGVPVHPFLQGLLLYYEIGICNLHLNSILLVSTFIHLCEAYVGIEPHFGLFRYLFCLRDGWRLQACRWSIPQSSRRDEESLPQLPMEHLPD